MRCEGTAFIMTRGPALAARDADQLLIVLQIEGSVDTDSAGRSVRREAGDVAISDYARPFHSVATDYAILIIHLARESVPAALLALDPHGLVFPHGSGAARLIGAAMQELYAQADHLTVSEAEAAIEGIAALTTAFARARLAGDEADHVKSRRKVALDYIDAHLGNPRLGPDEIVDAVNLSRASLYRLLAAEGGVRAVLLKRRLDEALRLMLAGQPGQAIADGNRQVLRLWRHQPVRPGVPRALRRAAATVPCARPPARPRLARSAAHRRRLRPGCLFMAATGVERTETIRWSGLSAAAPRAHLSTKQSPTSA